jgi:hypothetical protein
MGDKLHPKQALEDGMNGEEHVDNPNREIAKKTTFGMVGDSIGGENHAFGQGMHKKSFAHAVMDHR